jgi:hypothetical protein
VGTKRTNRNERHAQQWANPQAAAAARQAVIRRRRKVVGGFCGALVGASALASAFVWPGFALPEPAPAPTVTYTAPVPIPTITAAAREGEQTAFSSALPDSVLNFVQRNIAGIAAWPGSDSALESWRFTYADGLGSDAKTIVVDAGQWSDELAAEQFFAARLDALAKPLESGDVFVNEVKVGTYALVPSQASANPEVAISADGTVNTVERGVLYWRNGTVVIRAEGPLASLQQFYAAFPI